MTYPVPPAVPDLPVSTPAPETPEQQIVDAPRRVEATGEWRRVSPKYILVDLIGAGITAVIVIAVAILWAVLFQQSWQWWVMGALLAAIAIGAAFTPRRIRAIGYQLRQDDLLFRRGIMWTRMVAVPYGRMQLIDINRGPVARAFGLAELKFVTASAASAIVLPGLPEDEAEQLRDHLVVVAESRRTGL
ncbi:MAG: PH domain-containing protein [Mycetocola sp.]